MEGFTLIDGVAAVVIVLSAILAYSRGFVREAMAIAGWIGAAVLAFIFAESAQPLVKEIPVVGNFLKDSCELSIIVAFGAVLAVGLIVASLFTPLLSSVVQATSLSGLDQGLGFAFGVLRGILLVGVALLVYDRAVAENAVPMVDNSRSAKIFASFQANIDAAVPDDAPGWILSRYNTLTKACATPASAPAATTEPVAPSN